MNEQDDLASVFAAYRSDAAKGFAPPATETVFGAARARRTRRITVTAVAAVLVTASLITAGMLRSTAAIDQQPPGAGHSADAPSPTAAAATATPSAGNAPAKGSQPDNQLRFISELGMQRLRNSTITLPQWPSGSQVCVAGKFTFAAGRAAPYFVFLQDSVGIYTDLGGGPGDELVIPIACGTVEVRYQLLVVREVNGSLQTLGYLPGVPGFDRFFPQGGDLMVEVVDEQMSPTAEQRRRYHWNGTRFVQAGGPSSFPPKLDPDVRDVDLRNSYFKVVATSPEQTPPCGAGLLSFVDGRGGTWHPMGALEIGEISIGLLDEPARGYALVTVTCRPESGPATVWVFAVSAARATAVLRVGVDDVTRVVSHQIVDGMAEVTVTTKAGQQIWRFASDGYRLTRVP